MKLVQGSFEKDTQHIFHYTHILTRSTDYTYWCVHVHTKTKMKTKTKQTYSKFLCEWVFLYSICLFVLMPIKKWIIPLWLQLHSNEHSSNSRTVTTTLTQPATAKLMLQVWHKIKCVILSFGSCVVLYRTPSFSVLLVSKIYVKK